MRVERPGRPGSLEKQRVRPSREEAAPGGCFGQEGKSTFRHTGFLAREGQQLFDEMRRTREPRPQFR